MVKRNQLAAAIGCFLLSAMLSRVAGSLPAQQAPQFAGIQHLANSEAVLKLSAPAGLNFRIDASTNLATLANGDTTNLLGLSIEAVPMYNLTTTYHLKGAGNGYVLTIGGRRIYISGDTEDIAEMRALRGIDVALVCMNLPFTMSVDKAASAVREFRPGVIYPYHYQGSDLNKFKQLVGTDLGIEVRLRKWY